MRVFLGLKPDSVVLPNIAIPQPQHHPDDLHMTLAFIGECSQDQVAQLIEQINGLAPLPVCEWRSDCVSDFPSEQKAKVLAVQGEETNPSLETIMDRVSEVHCIKQHVREPFRPHVTLAPIKKATGIQWPFVHDWRFSRLCLYCSDKGRPKYRVLSQWLLGY